MSLTDRLERLERLRAALDLKAPELGNAGELSDEDARRIHEALRRLERGTK